MAKKKTIEIEGGIIGPIKRTLITLLLVALVLYIGIHIISRTDGVRSAVADKLSNGTRQLITLEKCGATPFFGLRLHGLSFQGVDIPEAKASFNWFAVFSKEKPLVKQLRIKSLDIEFRKNPVSGNWEPLVLHDIGSKVGEVIGLKSIEVEHSSLPRFPSHVINQETLLQLDRAKVVWRDSDGREIAYITDADLRLRTGRFIKRRVIQTIVNCGHIKLATGNALRDFRLEAFRVEGSGFVTVLDMADSNGLYNEFSSQTLWQDLNLYLNRLTQVEPPTAP
ncbi:MAG: hypothetical protein KJN67_04675 [Pontiella sp.]|nr:hypothetical protein [Pontiella sp.]MBT8046441.1 hypothetical protein [Pontiella sp.]NNJ70960.1 hypothetical protein [Kiritimatiellales bacterium]